MALIDVIKYDGRENGGSWLIHKYPGEQFVLGSQLIVNSGQEALFFKGGEALDLFGGGTHTLKSGNLPLLNKLVNLPFGRTPFAAEVYYVNKTSRLDMLWGSDEAFPIEDPKYGLLLNIRCRGKYGVRIVDSRQFVVELVGALSGGLTITHEFVVNYFRGLLNSNIKSIISAFMNRQKISFLEVTSYLQELSRECKASLDKEFERFGVELVNFFIESVTPPKDQYEKLRGYKEEMALGAGFYQQRRSLDIMEKMAENPNSGGLANAGIGFGMGLGMAPMAGTMFGNVAGNVNPQQPAEAAGVKCPHCGATNPEGRKFCGECGQSIVVGLVCPSCGKVNEKGQKFCGDCGTRLSKKCPTCGKDYDLSQKFCGDCGTKL